MGAQPTKDRRLVPQCQVLHDEVTTGVKYCSRASQDRKNEWKHGNPASTDSVNHQRFPNRMEFLLPTPVTSFTSENGPPGVPGESGGPYQVRTGDLLNAIEALYQLS